MQNHNSQIEINPVDAKAGSRNPMVRRVLYIGTALAILLLAIIWISGALAT